jgi:hypothetical protein
MLHVERSFLCCWNLDISESRSDVPEKFWNVVKEKNGENCLDRLCEKWSFTESQGEKYRTYNTKKEANWIVHILRRNCLLNTLLKET